MVLQVVLVVIVVGLAVAVGITWGRRAKPAGRAAGPSVENPLPEAEPIAAAWWAARDGDVDGYLACFAPPLRGRLEAELAAKGREGLAARLRADAAAALAIEFGPPRRAEAGRLVFPVTVQREGHAERLDYVVVREGKSWRIAEIEPCGRVTQGPPHGERLAPPAESGEER